MGSSHVATACLSRRARLCTAPRPILRQPRSRGGPTEHRDHCSMFSAKFMDPTSSAETPVRYG